MTTTNEPTPEECEDPQQTPPPPTGPIGEATKEEWDLPEPPEDLPEEKGAD
jgi:hypothetical protein